MPGTSHTDAGAGVDRVDAAGYDRRSTDRQAGLDALATDRADVDGAAPDASQPDARPPDAGQFDAGQFDASQPDAYQPDAHQPDAGLCSSGCGQDQCCAGQYCVDIGFPYCKATNTEDCAVCTSLGDRVDGCSATAGCVCLAAGAACASGLSCSSWGCCHPTAIRAENPVEFDPELVDSPELIQIDGTHLLLVAIGSPGTIHGRILGVDPTDWSIGAGARQPIATTTVSYVNGVLLPSGDGQFLLAHAGNSGHGFAEVLHVDVSADSISVVNAIEFDAEWAVFISGAVVGNNRFLLVYQSGSDRNYARMITYSPTTNALAAGPRHAIDSHGQGNQVVAVDDTRCLATYNGPGEVGRAVVLSTNQQDTQITVGTPVTFDDSAGTWTSGLIALDGEYFLDAHHIEHTTGRASLLRLTAGSTAPTLIAQHDFETNTAGKQSLVRLDQDHALVGYLGAADFTQVAIITLPSDRSAITATPAVTAIPLAGTALVVAAIDAHRLLAAISGPDDDGYAAVLHLPCALP